MNDEIIVPVRVNVILRGNHLAITPTVIVESASILEHTITHIKTGHQVTSATAEKSKRLFDELEMLGDEWDKVDIEDMKINPEKYKGLGSKVCGIIARIGRQ